MVRSMRWMCRSKAFFQLAFLNWTNERLLNTQRVSTLGVYLAQMPQTDVIGARLAQEHPTLRVKTWLDLATFYKAVKDLYNRIFGTLGLIIAVIVVFVVANAMAMAVIERTREIGTLRALGTLPAQLLQTLGLEGLLLGGAGALCGALIALAVTALLLVFPVEMPPPPGQTRGYPLLIAFDAWMYLATMVGMMALTVAASVWVARKTVHLPVVQALAHT